MSRRVSVKLLVVLCLGLFISTLSSGCVVVMKRPPRPIAKIEVKPVKPRHHAVWVAGHWKWKGHRRHGRWFWIPGHWKRR